MLVYIEKLGNKKSIFSRTIVRQTDLTVNRKTGLETLEAASKTIYRIHRTLKMSS